MKKNLMFNLTQLMFLLIAIISFVYYYQVMNAEILLLVVLFILMFLLVFSSKWYPKNIPFSLFLITFFTFLLGRITVVGLLGYKKQYVGILGTAFYDSQIIIDILTFLFISLLCLFSGFLIQIPVKQTLKVTSVHKEIQIVSKYIFLFSYALRGLVLLEMIRGTSTLGYYETFASFRSSLPESIIFLSEMYDISFFIFLGCMPRKKEATPIMILYLFEGFLSLWSGRRSDILLNVIILILYLFYREYYSEKKEKWISKKQILIGLGMLPLIFVLLNLIGNIRRGDSLSTSRVSESVADFFFAQGISINVLGYTINFKDSLPNKIYTFGPIIEFIKTKILIKLNGTDNFYIGQNISRALEGNLFSHTISYYIMPDLYLKGIGYGSSYVAELFKDFSYLGLMLGNMFYGFLLGNVYRILSSINPYFKGVFLLMIRQIMFAPRSSFTNFLVASLSFPKLFSIVAIFILSYILKQVSLNKKVMV